MSSEYRRERDNKRAEQEERQEEKRSNHKKIYKEVIYRNGKKITVKAAALSYLNFQRYIQLKYGILK